GAFGTTVLDRVTRVEVLNATVVDVGPAEALGTCGIIRLTEIQQTLLKRQIELASALSKPLAPHGLEETVLGPVAIGRAEGLNVYSTVMGVRDLTICCNETPRPAMKPLELYKWASAQSAQVGDVVTLYIKYSNHGGTPITDIAVADSL